MIELPTLSESKPNEPKANRSSNLPSDLSAACRALDPPHLRSSRLKYPYEVKLQMKLPARLWPQWAALSASKVSRPAQIPGAGSNRNFGAQQTARLGAGSHMGGSGRGQEAVKVAALI